MPHTRKMKYDRGTAVLGEKPLNAPRATPYHPTPSNTRVSRSMQLSSRSFFRPSPFLNFFLSIFLSRTRFTHPVLDRSTCWALSRNFAFLRCRRCYDTHFSPSISTLIPIPMRIVVKLDREIPSFESFLSFFSCLLKYFYIFIRIEWRLWE